MTDWKQQFDEKFEYVGIALNWYTHCLYSISKKSGEEHLLDIKKFINTELNQARKQERDKVLELAEKLAGDIYDKSGWHTGRQALVSELRQKIKEVK